MKTDLFIICAGKGSRMGGSLPKALVPITDKPCLTSTLQQVAHKFNQVYVVTNSIMQADWLAYFDDLFLRWPEFENNVNNLVIDSGLGDGHAVLSAFEKLENSLFEDVGDDVVIMWGDVFLPNAEIIDELLAVNYLSSGFHLSSGLIPAVRENNPYVTLLVDEHMNCISADFSKYGENHLTGFHDQSIFKFDKEELWTSLEALHNAFWKNGRYISPGGELSLLYTFHHLYNSSSPAKVYETNYPTLSFNTKEEVTAIQMEIDAKWNTQFRTQSL